MVTEPAPDEDRPDVPMYLVAELTVRDRNMLVRYASEVQPLMAEHGGQILAVSLAGADVLEGDWRPDLLVLHRWRSRAAFDRFWSSAEYAPIRDLRRAACESRIVVFDGFGGRVPGVDPSGAAA